LALAKVLTGFEKSSNAKGWPCEKTKIGGLWTSMKMMTWVRRLKSILFLQRSPQTFNFFTNFTATLALCAHITLTLEEK